jgi:RNA polymerase sigma-70 factor (ECF subfamily)
VLELPKEGALQVTVASESGPGETSALEKVFLEHQARVFRAAYRITGNAQDAEDVLQTVFLRLLRHQDEVPSARNPGSYLYRAAVNAALDVLRRRRSVAGVAVEDAEAQGTLLEAVSSRPDETHRALEIRTWLRSALARLTPRAAEVFALRYLEGYDNGEIARMLGTSRLAVAVALTRTRRRLRGELHVLRGGSK